MDYAAADSANFEKATKDVGELREFAETCPLGGRKMDLLLSRCFVLFKPDPFRKPAGANSGHPHRKFWHAMYAIQVFNIILSRCPRVEPLDTDNNRSLQIISDSIVEHWANVWKWVECGTMRCILRKVHPLDSDRYLWLFANLLEFMNCCWQGDPLRQMLLTAGHGPVVDLWYLHLREPHVLHDPTAITTGILYGWLRLEGQSREDRWKTMVARIGKTAREVVVVMLLHFQRYVLQIHFDGFRTVEPLIPLMLALSEVQDVRSTFLSLHSVYLFTRGLVHLSYDMASSPVSPRTDFRCSLRDTLCLYLCETFESAQGITWVRRSLEAGLLLGILRCAPRDPSDEGEEICRLITIVAKYLVYISVLRPVTRSMNKVDIPRMERDMVKAGPFWDIWTSVKVVTEERLLMAGSRISKRCKYEECDSMDIRADFKRCAGCEDASYCSSICQRRDWSDNAHRTYCKRVRMYHKTGKGVELSEEDMEFARLIFLDELRRRDDEIEQMYRRRHGKGPINTILEMDYTRFPPERTFLDGRLGEEPGGPTLHAKAPWGSSFVDIYVDPLRRKL